MFSSFFKKSTGQLQYEIMIVFHIFKTNWYRLTFKKQTLAFLKSNSVDLNKKVAVLFAKSTILRNNFVFLYVISFTFHAVSLYVETFKTRFDHILIWFRHWIINILTISLEFRFQPLYIKINIRLLWYNVCFWQDAYMINPHIY